MKDANDSLGEALRATEEELEKSEQEPTRRDSFHSE
jgi:hypothetical protein